MAIKNIPVPVPKPRVAGDLSSKQVEQPRVDTQELERGVPARDISVFEQGSSGVKAAAKGKVAELLWDKLEDGAELSLGDVKDGAALSAQVSSRKLDDKELKADPLRDGAWMETEGVVEGGVGLSTGVPVGAFNLNVGFSQDAMLRYRALTPGDDLKALKAVKLPTSAAAAEAMPVGASVEISGAGTRELSAGVNVGTSATTSAGELRAGAGLSHERTKRGEFAIEVTRLPDDQVRVTLRDLEERTQKTAGNLGVSLEIKAPSALAKAVGQERAEKLAGAVGDLELAIKAHKSRRETSTSEETFTFDLTSPAAREAFESLTRLRTGPAAELAAQGDAGVSRTTRDTDVVDARQGASIKAFDKTLLLKRALRQDSSTTSTDADGAVTLEKRSTSQREYSGIISGDKNISWTGVYASDGEREVSAQRMEFEKDDKVTGPKELARFVTFADALGVPVSASDLPERRGSLVGRLFSDRDDTKVKVDMLFTDDGLDKIASGGRQGALEAMKWSHAQFNTDMLDVPVHDERAQAIAAQYVKAKAEMRHKEGRPKEELRQKTMRLSSQYRKLTGRKMSKDFDLWKDATQFASHIDKMGAQPEAAWTGLFADLGDDKRFDYMHAMLALQHLATPEQTLVNALSIKGEGIDIEAGAT